MSAASAQATAVFFALLARNTARSVQKVPAGKSPGIGTTPCLNQLDLSVLESERFLAAQNFQQHGHALARYRFHQAFDSV